MKFEAETEFFGILPVEFIDKVIILANQAVENVSVFLKDSLKKEYPELNEQQILEVNSTYFRG